MTTTDLTHAPVAAAAIAAAANDGDCPTCNLGGVTPERARREAPRWYAALTTLPPRAVPDEPAACCWDCRAMIAAGLDPAAIIAPDHAEYRAAQLRTRPTHVGSRTITALCDEMHLAGRGELVHYAGASYRDDVAWQMCLAWLADRSADEATLKSRALKAAWGWDLSPEDIRRASGAVS